MTSEEQKRIAYCKEHNVHHLFELLATRLLVERPGNPFEYLHHLLSNVEESERKKHSYDPTVLPPQHPVDAEATDTTNNADADPLKKITIGAFGLDNAGKTTLIAALGGRIDRNTTPTVGFNPTQFQTDKYDICIFDIGGAANFRGIWVHYFHDCHGLIYVVDSSATEAAVQESLDVFKGLVRHPCMRGKPLLLLANKKDLPHSRREAVVPDGLLDTVLVPGTPHRVVASCGLEEDAGLDDGVEWLLEAVAADYDALDRRVAEDTAAVKAEAKRKAAERLAALRGAH